MGPGIGQERYRAWNCDDPDGDGGTGASRLCSPRLGGLYRLLDFVAVAMTVPSSRWQRLALTLSGVLAAGSVAAMVMVERGRSAIAADVFVPPSPDDITHPFGRGLYPELTGLKMAGALAIGAILVACLGRFVAGRRAPRDGAPWPALLFALLPACLASCSTVGRWLRAFIVRPAPILPPLASGRDVFRPVGPGGCNQGNDAGAHYPVSAEEARRIVDDGVDLGRAASDTDLGPDPSLSILRA